MIRQKYLNLISNNFRVNRVCALLGPRQVGKTTLARQFAQAFPSELVHFFDLENPIDLARLSNPMLALPPLMKHEGSLVVIDEIQRRPDLFPQLRVLVDTYQHTKVLILGSASRDLLQQSSETLAGRIGYIELFPFSLTEMPGNTESLWLRGGFPSSFLAQTIDDSFLWRENYIKTFLERDIPSLGFNAPAQQVYRFWMMLCHYHGQLVNFSELGKSLGQTNYTIHKYLDILVGTFMIRTLHPWFENISKRQVKAPKIYFRDSGILHALLTIKTLEQLTRFPKLGAFWEGFALEEILRKLAVKQEEAFFWGTQSGAELDLLVLRNGKRYGFEFKYTDMPKTTTSMHIALQDLGLEHLTVIHPGSSQFPLTEKITACGLEAFVEQETIF